MDNRLRIVNIVLGVWLFISAFIWPHSQAQMTNTWIVGLLIAAFAAGALARPVLRYVNTALAVWLLVSTLFLPYQTMATVWHNVLLAIAVLVVSLVPSRRARMVEQPQAR